MNLSAFGFDAETTRIAMSGLQQPPDDVGDRDPALPNSSEGLIMRRFALLKVPSDVVLGVGSGRLRNFQTMNRKTRNS